MRDNDGFIRGGGPAPQCEFRSATATHVDRQVLECLSLCIREEFGETYPDRRVYDINALVEMTAEHRLITSALIREDGEPVAVIGLKECPPFHGVGELSMHVVRKVYRGCHVGSPLVQHIMNLPETRRLASVVSHSATYHPIAQHESFRVGLIPCGALYSQHTNELLSHSFEKVGGKQTFLVAVRPAEKTNADLLYLPKEHRDFIADTYHRIGATCQVAKKNGPLADSTQLLAEENELYQTLTGTVARCGPELGCQVRDLMNYWGVGRSFQTFTLFLNANDPSAPAGYDILREMGFHFAGLHPLCRGAEYLILHHPMNVEIPFERLCVDENYQAVFDYLSAHYDD